MGIRGAVVAARWAQCCSRRRPARSRSAGRSASIVLFPHVVADGSRDTVIQLSNVQQQFDARPLLLPAQGARRSPHSRPAPAIRSSGVTTRSSLRCSRSSRPVGSPRAAARSTHSIHRARRPLTCQPENHRLRRLGHGIRAPSRCRRRCRFADRCSVSRSISVGAPALRQSPARQPPPSPTSRAAAPASTTASGSTGTKTTTATTCSASAATRASSARTARSMIACPAAWSLHHLPDGAEDRAPDAASTVGTTLTFLGCSFDLKVQSAETVALGLETRTATRHPGRRDRPASTAGRRALVDRSQRPTSGPPTLGSAAAVTTASRARRAAASS